MDEIAACGGAEDAIRGGVVKNGWGRKTISEVCDAMNGGTPKTGVADYWDGPHRWITPAEMGRRI
ncbi:MAG: hypothetical protein ACRESZ_15605, partial [Methylococcales bacterium]